MRVFDAPLKNEVCPNGIVSFELAKDLSVSKNILNSWDDNAKANAGLSLGFDFLFLIVYSSFIALLIYNLNNRFWKDKGFYKVGRVLVYLIFVAAIFDIIENIALIELLKDNLIQVWASIAYYFASLKFIFILICLLYVIINWLAYLLVINKKDKRFKT